jgi:hypothetical protein
MASLLHADAGTGDTIAALTATRQGPRAILGLAMPFFTSSCASGTCGHVSSRDRPAGSNTRFAVRAIFERCGRGIPVLTAEGKWVFHHQPKDNKMKMVYPFVSRRPTKGSRSKWKSN